MPFNARATPIVDTKLSSVTKTASSRILLSFEEYLFLSSMLISDQLPSWQELENLAEQNGDSMWLLDSEKFNANSIAFRNAFIEAGWSNTTLAWSLKTLWIPPVVEAAIALGGLAEVVSPIEYDIAIALGIDPRLVIVNGPLKTISHLDRVTAAGSQVNLDGPDEAADILTLVKKYPGRQFRVGLRVNIDIGIGQRSRFGFDAETDDLFVTFRELATCPQIAINGLHVHQNNTRVPEIYRRQSGRIVELVDALWGSESSPDFIDLGGGFAGAMPESLWRQIGHMPASPEAYAAAIIGELRRRWPEGGPQLILEPGIALAANAMRFACRVGAIKMISGIRHAFVTASVYAVKPTLHPYDLPMQVVRPNDRLPNPGHTTVSGWTCVEDDILATDCELELVRGDWLVFDNCGAYSFVMSPRFIRGTPAIVEHRADGWRTVRRADTAADWLDPFTRKP
jgi:diaminopimelate decarboxylase